MQVLIRDYVHSGWCPFKKLSEYHSSTDANLKMQLTSFATRACCSDHSSKDLFFGKCIGTYCILPLRKSAMVRLPCCDKFQPLLQFDNNLHD